MNSLSKHSIFPVLIISVFLPMLAWAKSPPSKPDWEIALQGLQEHTDPIIVKAQKATKDQNVSLVRYQSRLLEKYLPKHRLYVIDSSLGSSDRIFLLQEDSTFYSLGHGNWKSIDAEGTFFHSPKLSNFLIVQKIKVDSEETAIDMAKLLEEISYAPNEVLMLRNNTTNYTVYKKDLLQHLFSSHLNWKYFAEKTKTGYKASRNYIGPEASIMAPQMFYLELNDKNELVKITAKSYLGH